MKCLTLFIVFSCLIGLNDSNSQTNIYFENNPVWTQSSNCAVGYPCVREEVFEYRVEGDTLINNLTYVKIFKSGYGNYNWFAPPPSFECSGSYNFSGEQAEFYLRSEDKKIFFLSASEPQELLLFDFNLELGDTLPMSYTNYSEIIVSDVDSILIDGSFHKRFMLEGESTAEYIIEGIGSSNGLIESISPILECGYTLRCFKLNNETILATQDSLCDLILSSPKIQLPNFSIYPNPFDDKLNLSLKGNEVNEREILVFNSAGIRVKTIQTPQNEVELDLTGFPQGFYFLSVRSNNEIKFQRLMKVKN